MKKQEEKVMLKFKISHPDPEKEKEGVEAFKEFVKVIAEMTGEEGEIIEKKIK